MKLALAFVLAICAISAQASNFADLDPVYTPTGRDGFLDNIKEFIENAISNIKQTVTDLVEKAKDVGSVVKDKVEEAVKEFTEKVTKFEEIIKDLAGKGLAYKKCVEENKPKLDALYEKAKEDVKTCTTGALEAAESLRGKVVDEVAKVKEYVESLREAIKGCYDPSKPLDSFTCAINKVNEAKNQFSAIVSEVTKIINEATTAATTSVTCIKTSVTENEATAKAIVEQIKTCAAQSSTVMRKEAALFAVFEPVYFPMPRDGFIDKIKDFIENAISNIKQTVTDLIEKAKDVGSGIKDKVEQAVKEFTEKVTKFEGIIKDLAGKGLAYKKCVEENKPELDALVQKAKQDVKTCTADALEFAEGLRGKVVDEVAKVKQYVESLREAIKGCYDPSKPVDSFTCAVNKVSEAKDEFSTIVSEVTKFINEATSVATSSVTCIKTSVTENEAKAKAIVEQIKTCAAQSSTVMRKEAALFAVFEPVYFPMPRDGFVDKIKDFIENAISNIKQTVTDLVEKAKEVGSGMKDKIEQAVKEFTEKVTKFEEIVKDLAGKGLAYKKCVEENKPEFDALVQKAKQDVKTCTADALEFAEGLRGKVVDEVSKIKEYVESLREAIKGCYDPSKPLDSFTCAVNKVSEAKDQFSTIVSEVTKFISEATSVATSSVTCIKTSVTENEAKAKAIVEQIKTCAAA